MDITNLMFGRKGRFLRKYISNDDRMTWVSAETDLQSQGLSYVGAYFILSPKIFIHM